MVQITDGNFPLMHITTYFLLHIRFYPKLHFVRLPHRARKCQEIFCISQEIILFIINFLFYFKTLENIVKVMFPVVYKNANQITLYIELRLTNQE